MGERERALGLAAIVSGNASSPESCNNVVNISANAAMFQGLQEGARERGGDREIPQVLISASLKETLVGKGRERGQGRAGLAAVFPLRKFLPHATFIVHSLRVST